jgi:hypothetical protein
VIPRRTLQVLSVEERRANLDAEAMSNPPQCRTWTRAKHDDFKSDLNDEPLRGSACGWSAESAAKALAVALEEGGLAKSLAPLSLASISSHSLSDHRSGLGVG